MKFDFLTAAIDNRSTSEPSLYSAVCVIESLFKDFETAAHCNIESVPMGDERLPNKLLWLCGRVIDIYNENQAQFTRSKDSLAEMLGNIRGIESELAAYSNDPERMESEKLRLARLTEELNDAMARRERLEEISAKCAELEAQINSQPDPSVEDAEKRYNDLKLKLEITQFEQSKKREDISRLEADIESAEKAAQGLEEELSASGKQLDEINTRIAALEHDNTDVKVAIAAQSEELALLNTETERLKADEEGTRASIAAAQDKKLAADAALKTAQGECAEITAELDRLNEQKTRLLAEVDQKKRLAAEQEEDLKRVTDELTPLQNTLDGLKIQSGRLEEKRRGILTEIGDLQSYIDKTELAWDADKQRLAGLVDGETERLRDILAKLDDSIFASKNELLNLRVQLPEKDAELSRQKKQLDDVKEQIQSLDADISQGNAELDSLNKEYTQKSSLASGRSQLEATRSALREQIAELDRQIILNRNLESEIARFERENSEKQQMVERFNERKSAVERDKSRLDNLFTEKREQEIRDLERDFVRLEAISRELTGDSAKLFSEPFEAVDARFTSNMEICKQFVETFKSSIRAYLDLHKV